MSTIKQHNADPDEPKNYRPICNLIFICSWNTLYYKFSIAGGFLNAITSVFYSVACGILQGPVLGPPVVPPPHKWCGVDCRKTAAQLLAASSLISRTSDIKLIAEKSQFIWFGSSYYTPHWSVVCRCLLAVPLHCVPRRQCTEPGATFDTQLTMRHPSWSTAHHRPHVHRKHVHYCN